MGCLLSTYSGIINQFQNQQIDKEVIQPLLRTGTSQDLIFTSSGSISFSDSSQRQTSSTSANQSVGPVLVRLVSAWLTAERRIITNNPHLYLLDPTSFNIQNGSDDFELERLADITAGPKTLSSTGTGINTTNNNLTTTTEIQSHSDRRFESDRRISSEPQGSTTTTAITDRRVDTTATATNHHASASQLVPA